MAPPSSGRPVGLDGARLKLHRAEDHLNLFDREVKAWLNRQAIQIIPESHADSLGEARKRMGLPPWDVPDVPCIHRTYRAKFNEPIPPEWSVLLGDAIHNLRSSLDHLVWQLASPPLGTGATTANEFPIYESFADFQTHGTKKLRGLDSSAVALVEGIKPYRGGGQLGDMLFLLNRLSRFDKHRVLNLVAVIPDAHSVGAVKGEPVHTALFHNVGVTLEDGAIVAEVLFPPDSEVDRSGHVFIHFEPGGPGEGWNVGFLVRTLKGIRDDILPRFAHLFP